MSKELTKAALKESLGDLYSSVLLRPARDTDYLIGVGTPQVLVDPDTDGLKLLFTGWSDIGAVNREVFIGDLDTELTQVTNITKLLALESGIRSYETAYAVYDGYTDTWLLMTGARLNTGAKVCRAHRLTRNLSGLSSTLGNVITPSGYYGGGYTSDPCPVMVPGDPTFYCIYWGSRAELGLEFHGQQLMGARSEDGESWTTVDIPITRYIPYKRHTTIDTFEVHSSQVWKSGMMSLCEVNWYTPDNWGAYPIFHEGEPGSATLGYQPIGLMPLTALPNPDGHHFLHPHLAWQGVKVPTLLYITYRYPTEYVRHEIRTLNVRKHMDLFDPIKYNCLTGTPMPRELEWASSPQWTPFIPTYGFKKAIIYTWANQHGTLRIYRGTSNKYWDAVEIGSQTLTQNVEDDFVITNCPHSLGFRFATATEPFNFEVVVLLQR